MVAEAGQDPGSSGFTMPGSGPAPSAVMGPSIFAQALASPMPMWQGAPNQVPAGMPAQPRIGREVNVLDTLPTALRGQLLQGSSSPALEVPN